VSESLRDRLLQRERPVATYTCRVAPVADTQRAEQDLAAALKALRGVRPDDETAAATAQEAVATAQERRDACYEQILLQALPPDAYEAIGDAYPLADEGAEEKVRLAADEAYLHAVFLSCVQGELTSEEWTTFVHTNLSTGERNDLYTLANAVNGRVRALDPSVPKG